MFGFNENNLLPIRQGLRRKAYNLMCTSLNLIESFNNDYIF